MPIATEEKEQLHANEHACVKGQKRAGEAGGDCRLSRPKSLPAQFMAPLDRLAHLFQPSSAESWQSDADTCLRRLRRLSSMYAVLIPVHQAYEELVDYVTSTKRFANDDLVFHITDVLRALSRRRSLMRGEVLDAISGEVSVLVRDLIQFLQDLVKQGAFVRKLFSRKNNKRRGRLRERMEEADVRVRFFVRVRPASHMTFDAGLDLRAEESVQPLPSSDVRHDKAHRDLNLLPLDPNAPFAGGAVLQSPTASNAAEPPARHLRSTKSGSFLDIQMHDGTEAGIAMFLPSHREPSSGMKSRKGSRTSTRSHRSHKDRDDMARMQEMGKDKVNGWLAGVDVGDASAMDDPNPPLIEADECASLAGTDSLVADSAGAT